MISHAMNYADRFAQELAYLRADLPILTADKIEQRCRTLSLLLTAAVRSGEMSTTQVSERTTSSVGFERQSGISQNETGAPPKMAEVPASRVFLQAR
ncbi:MAG: hypothetical protein ABSA52_23030 [Candidatus Binatia bacterium]|jgi:hypothetical protein